MFLELRYALRRLRDSPGFTITAVVTLALAIGTTTAMVGVLDAVLLRPLPFPSPERLTVVWLANPGQGVHEGRSAYRMAEAWRAASRSLEDVAVSDPVSLTVDHGGVREQTGGARVSPNLFTLLGVAPERGRLITEADAAGRERVALVSHRFWQARLNASPSAIGTTVLIDGQPSQIVGVLPASLADTVSDADIWEPHTIFPDWQARRVAAAGTWAVFVRLRAGSTIDATERELAAIAARVDGPQPGPTGRTVRVVPLREQLTGSRSRTVAWTMAGATALLWLVAAVNVAGLTLARGIARLPQLAIQAALGADRRRLVRSQFTEGGVLAALAGVAGVGVAAAAIAAIRAIGPAYVARLADVRLDLPVLGGVVAVSALTAIVIGLTPSMVAWRRDLRITGVDGGRQAGSGSASRVRRVFVAGECAVAVVLLAGAGLLARSWWNASRIDAGFRGEQVVSLNVAPPVDLPAERRAAFYDAVLTRVAALPGVERAGISSELFVGTVREQPLIVEGGPQAGPQTLALRSDEIAGDVFETLGTPLLRGRAFTPADGRTPGLVAIVNAAMANRLWPGRDPIGRRFALGPPAAAPAWFTVVGVVADMRRQGLEIVPVPQMFEPVAQTPSRRAILFARLSHADPLSSAGALRAAVHAVDSAAVVYRATLVAERFGAELAQRRLQTALLLACATITLLLAALGLYTLIQHAVAARTHEIGVRMALGARPADIGWMIAGEGLALAASGLAIGLAGAWALSRAASALLFGVGAADPPTLIAVSAVAIAVAAAASSLPARRAARLAPILALRRRVP